MVTRRRESTLSDNPAYVAAVIESRQRAGFCLGTLLLFCILAIIVLGIRDACFTLNPRRYGFTHLLIRAGFESAIGYVVAVASLLGVLFAAAVLFLPHYGRAILKHPVFGASGAREKAVVTITFSMLVPSLLLLLTPPWPDWDAFSWGFVIVAGILGAMPYLLAAVTLLVLIMRFRRALLALRHRQL